jgi:hypothetical protein
VFVFLVAALLAYAVVAAGALPIGRRRKAGPPRSAAIAAAVVAAGLYGLLVWRVVDADFLESARNFQLLLGSLFGALVWLLPLADTLATRFGSTSSGEGGAAAPWWTRPSAMVALALVALPLVALIAPHGRLDLGFLRSVKTPFLEAQFVRNETQLRLQLESEPQGFFRVGRTGLGAPLDLARNELIYLHNRADRAAEERIAETALAFVVEVLQPVARCVYEVDRLYGVRQLLVDSLHVMGRGLARAVVIAARTDTPAEVRREGIMASLRYASGELDVRRERQLAALGIPDADREDAQPSPHPCARFDPASHEDFADDIVEIMGRPSVVHAATMFFLWAGNPGAALTMIRHLEQVAPRGDPAAQVDYPGLQHARGFAERWVADSGGDPRRYLDDWSRGVEQLEARRRGLLRARPDLLEGCAALSSEPVALTPAQLTSRLVDRPGADPLPKGCGADAARCDARLAYGYFTHQIARARNHIVYETAREIMTGRDFPDRSLVLERASAQIEALLEEVDAEDFDEGGCFIQQIVVFGDDGASRAAGGVASPPTIVPLTTVHPIGQHATALDSEGSLLLARAVVDGRVDPNEIDRAVTRFEQALRYGAISGLSPAVMATIRGHRDQALRATGAAVP